MGNTVQNKKNSIEALARIVADMQQIYTIAQNIEQYCEQYAVFAGSSVIQDMRSVQMQLNLKSSVIYSTLDPDLEKQKIRYEVSDSSGNKAENSLLVLIEPLMATQQEEEPDPEETVQSEEKPQQPKPAATPAPTAAPAPVATPQPPVQYEEYDETFSYEENGGVTTCTVHHGSNGSTSQSCEWIGPWEEYD